MAMQHFPVQPRGRDPDRKGTVVHETATEGYEVLDQIAETRQRHGFPDDWLEMHAVDKERRPVTRPGVP